MGGIKYLTQAEYEALQAEIGRLQVLVCDQGREMVRADAEIERLRADLAGVDAVLFYYIAKDWPSYTEREREGKTWRPEMMGYQSAAIARHSERMKTALEQKVGDS